MYIQYCIVHLRIRVYIYTSSYSYIYIYYVYVTAALDPSNVKAVQVLSLDWPRWRTTKC